jgi:hypothetical protein
VIGQLGHAAQVEELDSAAERPWSPL